MSFLPKSTAKSDTKGVWPICVSQSVIASPCASLRARLRRSSRSWLRAAAALQNWSQPAATVLQCCCTVLYCCTELLLYCTAAALHCTELYCCCLLLCPRAAAAAEAADTRPNRSVHWRNGCTSGNTQLITSIQKHFIELLVLPVDICV